MIVIAESVCFFDDCNSISMVSAPKCYSLVIERRNISFSKLMNEFILRKKNCMYIRNFRREMNNKKRETKTLWCHVYVADKHDISLTLHLIKSAWKCNHTWVFFTNYRSCILVKSTEWVFTSTLMVKECSPSNNYNCST
jgi:hypothetical protein